MNIEDTEQLFKTLEDTELFKTLASLSQKRIEILILILVLFAATIILLFINKFTTKNKSLSTIYIASIFIEVSFALPITLNLSFQKDGPGPLLLQSLLTISGGLVVLLGYIENRRKNDIDELKNADEKIQRTQSSRYEKSIKSIELLSSKDTFSAISAVHNLCRLADEWIDEWINTPGETYRKSEQEAQAIVNVLCTYIRESGKSNHGNYKDAVGETIMNEIYNRLDRSDNSHSLWGGLDFNFKGANFTFPIKLKKIAGVEGMDFKGCTFHEDLEISLLIEYKDKMYKTKPGKIILDDCIFKKSVTLQAVRPDNYFPPQKPTPRWKIWSKDKKLPYYIEMSEISLQDTQFTNNSNLTIRRFSGEIESKDKVNININGILPSKTLFHILSHAKITIDEKPGLGNNSTSSKVQKKSIKDSVDIRVGEEILFKIPSENHSEYIDSRD
ncbi:hypothetical protein [Rothia sp. HMSC073B08]|uniref:Pentapeptide repeat-containing protein n=1 Tax=Rothia dentocariosa TaxID=2047 RepID=A0A930KLL6_9MICC|nr:hypothetical protein [Rothia sp. HMSC073B08]MBF1650569.1 hypothetical protein [Rothia dentocariosa]